MYIIRLINPMVQFEHMHWTLTFEDTDGVFPLIRVEKKYPEGIENAEITANVRATIETLCQMETAPPPVFDEEGNFSSQDPGQAPDLAGTAIEVHRIGGTVEQWLN